MTDPFLSSEEYDERAHALYNEGKYDEALAVLREGLALYPQAVELHVGLGYARLAREEYAWARRSFDDALALDAEHEDALAGLGEVLMKFGQHDQALRTFERTLELGYDDDIELMLQVGRALFREGQIDEAKRYFDTAVRQTPDNAEAVACVGYTLHRLGDDTGAAEALERALALDEDHVEARIYLGNLLYDANDYPAALAHLERATPEDHWDELGIWRTVELMKSLRDVTDGDPRLAAWEARLSELAGEPDSIDEMLAELELPDDDADADGQLDLFGDDAPAAPVAVQPSLPPSAMAAHHRVVTVEGREIDGTWDEIVSRLRDTSGAELQGGSVDDFMAAVASRHFRAPGGRLSAYDAESFIRASAAAGLLRIVR
jgi:tetratricopeptide (TPR) repeat protein